MRFPLRLATIIITVLVATTLVSPAVAAPSSAPESSPDDATLIRRAVELTNAERVRQGLNPLKWNDQLAAAATAYAQDMAGRGFFAHNSPDGTTPIDRARRAGYPAYGWGGLYVGENLARGYNSADSVHEGWMNSESHRQNLLHAKYREIGIGIAVAPNGTRYWAQEFGSRPNVLPVFLNLDAGATESPQVTIRLTDEQVSPWGSLTELAGMMVSNRPDFAGSVWEPFQTIKTWTLSAQPGLEAVYVRLRDANGRVIETYDDIEYVGRMALAVGDPEAVEEAANGSVVAGEAPEEAPEEAISSEDAAPDE